MHITSSASPVRFADRGSELEKTSIFTTTKSFAGITTEWRKRKKVLQKIQHKKQELGKGVFLALSSYSTVFRTILLYEENSVYIEED